MYENEVVRHPGVTSVSPLHDPCFGLWQEFWNTAQARKNLSIFKHELNGHPNKNLS